MFRARPPFFGMKAGCFMLQSRAGGSSALRAPPTSTGAASSGSGCALGVPPPLSSHPTHTSQALLREPEVRGAAEEGPVPAGEEDITEQELPSAGPPGQAPHPGVPPTPRLAKHFLCADVLRPLWITVTPALRTASSWTGRRP